MASGTTCPVFQSYSILVYRTRMELALTDDEPSGSSGEPTVGDQRGLPTQAGTHEGASGAQHLSTVIW